MVTLSQLFLPIRRWTHALCSSSVFLIYPECRAHIGNLQRGHDSSRLAAAGGAGPLALHGIPGGDSPPHHSVLQLVARWTIPGNSQL